MSIITSKPIKQGFLTLLQKVEQIGAKNLRLVNETCVSGATLERNLQGLANLRKTGINTVIDFRGEAGPAFAKACEDSGLKYVFFPLEHTRTGLSGLEKAVEGCKVTDDFVKQLKNFIDTVNEGHAYMGCNFGIDRTNLGLVLNYLINPQAIHPPKILTWGDFRTKSVINKTLKIARKTIKKMTPEQKKYLGLPDNYNDIFQEKISKMLALNIYS